jgi:hypothetical protein
MELEQIWAVWTHCYHITSADNAISIRRSRLLQPAQTLLIQAKREDLLNRRRTEDVLLRMEGGQHVLIRNQCPLDPDSLDLGPTGTLAGYVACLNSHVYVWPGTASGPIDDGVRMVENSSCVRSIIVKVPTRSLFHANRTVSAYVSTCNTGVAWTERGIKSRRGPEVFQPIMEFSEDPLRIREICFAGNVSLSGDTEYSGSPVGPWRTLFNR